MQLERGGVSYTDARKKGSETSLQLVSLRKNFQNGVPLHSIKKIPQVLLKKRPASNPDRMVRK
jgi:hypothetical protein